MMSKIWPAFVWCLAQLAFPVALGVAGYWCILNFGWLIGLLAVWPMVGAMFMLVPKVNYWYEKKRLT